MDLVGASALVTGAASGLGAATVRALQRAGVRCVLADLKDDEGAALAAEVGGIYAHTDVASADDVAAAVNAAQELGTLRVLVNCAGIGWAGRTVDRSGAPHDLAAFERVLRVNLLGTFNCIRLAAAAMAKTAPLADGERGVIVNTASIAAFDGQTGQAAYSASKGGIVGMTLPIARDLVAIGVRVVTIAPGLIDTPIYGAGEGSEQFKAHLAESTLFPRRLGTADEFADAALSLITNSYFNATTVRMDAAQARHEVAAATGIVGPAGPRALSRWFLSTSSTTSCPPSASLLCRPRRVRRVAPACRHWRPCRTPPDVGLSRIRPAGDVIVMNDTKVLRSRVRFRRATGRRRRGAAARTVRRRRTASRGGCARGRRCGRWRGRRVGSVGAAESALAPGTRVESATISRLCSAPISAKVAASYRRTTDLVAALDAHGEMPLPPYLPGRWLIPRATRRVRSAAGLGGGADRGATSHDRPLDACDARGASVARVELVVGLDTFRPITVDDLSQHQMHSEHYRVPEATMRGVRGGRARSSPSAPRRCVRSNRAATIGRARRPHRISSSGGATSSRSSTC